jgi:hypothetical protein
MAPLMLFLYGAGAAIFDVAVSKHNPEQRVFDPLRIAMFGVWSLAAMLITVLALCTFDSTDWGTRAKAAAPVPEPTPMPKPQPRRLPLPQAAFAPSGD